VVIDPVLLRETPDVVRASQERRGASVGLVDEAVEADAARRSAIAAFESLRAEQNAFGKTVAKAPKDEKAGLVAQAQELAARVKEAQRTASEAEARFTEVAGGIPNIVLDGVPAGGEDDFVTLREVGGKPEFDFEPRDHLALGELLDAIDMERGAKVSGARFYFLKGVGARLEFALVQLGLQRALESGFTPLITPTLVRPDIMAGTGFLGAHADEVYYLERDDLYLTGTSEVALAGYHKDEILDLSDGPKRYAGISTCYRREAGSGGKDTRGIIRVHQFQKLEMFTFCAPEDAVAEHRKLLAWEKQFLDQLEIPYRVIDVATGDLGASAARKFDVEAWIPTQGTYREVTSTSNTTEFQARRLRIRVREGNAQRPLATLNGTLCAMPRIIVALLENHQQADGSVRIPSALQPYLGGRTVFTAPA
jgi:seryl-tRNA synthetase